MPWVLDGVTFEMFLVGVWGPRKRKTDVSPIRPKAGGGNCTTSEFRDHRWAGALPNFASVLENGDLRVPVNGRLARFK